MKKEFQICGLGNAIIDIFIEVSDAEFQALGFERGSMRLVDKAEQQTLLDKFHSRSPVLVSGGSVANSIIAFAQLGGKAAFIGCVGDDRYGLHYQNEFEELGIDMGNPVIVQETSGTCVCLITPDAERTMRTNIAVAGHVSEKQVDEQRIAASEWLFVEGYLFANPESGQGAIRKAIDHAKKHGTKVAITSSDAFVIDVFHEPFFAALKHADLLFCNAGEARAATKTHDVVAAFAKLKELVPNCVVTDGPNGAHVRYDGREVHVPAFECEPKDLTGAGDMFAGAFLYGICDGVPVRSSARAACYLAMKVITQVGARLHHGTRDYWMQAIGFA